MYVCNMYVCTYMYVCTCMYVSFRLYPYLCRAVRNFAKDYGEVNIEKEYYAAFVDLPTRHK